MEKNKRVRFLPWTLQLNNEWISAHWPNLTANRTQYSSCHVNLSASGIYFGSPFGYYPTFHTLTSIGRKQYFQYVKRMFPLFRAILFVVYYDWMFGISWWGPVAKNAKTAKTWRVDQHKWRNGRIMSCCKFKTGICLWKKCRTSRLNGYKCVPGI